MNRSANPALVGAFVLGALAILVAIILILGGGTLFERRVRFVVYFDESVKGLRRGANVAFRGVPVGTVKEIRAEYALPTGTVEVPVVIEIDPQALSIRDGRAVDERLLQRLVDAGLRAQLQLESLLTGQLYVALDIHPEAAPPRRHPEASYPEIPSLPSPWSRLRASLDELMVELPATVARAKELLRRMERLLNDRNLERAARLLDGAARTTDELARSARELSPLLAEVRATAQELRALLADLGARIERRDADLARSLASVTEAARRFAVMSEEIRRMVANSRPGIEDFSQTGLPLLIGLIEDTTRMVNELDALLRDIRQDPARFFFGDRVYEGIKP